MKNKEQPVHKITFKAQLVSENSFTARKLGEAENTMELRLHDGQPSGGIEWISTLANGAEIVTEIGVWFDHSKKLIDYDGVFELPKEAVVLLRKAGFVVIEDKEGVVI